MFIFLHCFAPSRGFLILRGQSLTALACLCYSLCRFCCPAQLACLLSLSRLCVPTWWLCLHYCLSAMVAYSGFPISHLSCLCTLVPQHPAQKLPLLCRRLSPPILSCTCSNLFMCVYCLTVVLFLYISLLEFKIHEDTEGIFTSLSLTASLYKGQLLEIS